VHDFISNDMSTLRENNTHIYNLNIKNYNFNSGKISFTKDITCNTSVIKEKFINVIVVDDEVFTRQATIRNLYTISKDLNIKINIIEAEDGIETMYLVYKAATQGVKISLIFSDENMIFMNGVRSSDIIKEVLERKRMGDIDFYLVTAYDNTLLDGQVSSSIKKVLSKPLAKDVAKSIISEYCNQ
jgi:hypothetical protein